MFFSMLQVNSIWMFLNTHNNDIIIKCTLLWKQWKIYWQSVIGLRAYKYIGVMKKKRKTFHFLFFLNIFCN